MWAALALPCCWLHVAYLCVAACGGLRVVQPSSTQRRRRSSTGKTRRGSRGAPQAPSPSTGRRSQRRTPAPAPGATVSQQNHANAGSSGPRQARKSGLNLFGDDEPLMFTSGNGTGHDGAPSLPQPSHSGGGSLSHPRQAPAQPPLAQAGPPGASASQAGALIRVPCGAWRVAAAEQRLRVPLERASAHVPLADLTA